MYIQMPDSRSVILLKHAADEPLAKLLRAGLDAHDWRAKQCLVNADLLPEYFSYLIGHPESPAFPTAQEIYTRYQLEACGGEPLAEGAQQWPEQLADHTSILDVSPDKPVRGWRMWSLQEGYLVAPFGIMMRDEGGRDAPGVTWAPGLKVNGVDYCREGESGEVHPILECRCGLRAMQSVTVLRAFTDHCITSEVMEPPDAIGEVDMWGRVAGWAPGADWHFTARAQYAQPVGRLHLKPEHEPQRADLEKRYGFEPGGGPLDDLPGWNPVLTTLC